MTEPKIDMEAMVVDDPVVEEVKIDISREETIVTRVTERFPYLLGTLTIQRPGRIISNPLQREHFEEVLAYLISEQSFYTFHLVIGVDDGDDLGFIYAISNTDKIVFLLKERAPKSDPRIRSLCDIFPNALWHERELVDLFGAVLEGLPPGPTYPLPDNWPAGNYPMRKEWNPAYFDNKTMTYNPPAAKTTEGGAE